MPVILCPQCGKPTASGLCAGACPECLAASMLGNWDQLEETTEPAPEAIITRVADYDVLRVLGRGGMGVVCRARDRLLGREVALKLIHSGVLASDEELRRFRLEAEAVASLRHPHLIVVHETGEADGQPYFTMTLAEHGTLAARIQQSGALPPHTAASLVRDVASAVHHAHSRGVLHRDLKPANILFDSDDHALVSDFGLARFTGADSVTKSGSLLGTPGYLAPEVASGSAGHTTSSDVYALGVILFECLTGRPPFENDSPLALLKSITEDETPAPSSLIAGIDHDLEAICLRSLEKDPARRYPSAEAMGADLSLWLAGEPVSARHPPLTERFWRWAQRNQSRAVLYSMATVSVFILVLLSAVWNVLLSTEQSHTEEARYRSEVRRAALLRDYAVQFMSSPATMLRALPHLEEAATLTTGDVSEDQAIQLRQRVIQRLSPLLLQQWKITTAQPELAWSPDSRTAAFTDDKTVTAFDLARSTSGDAALATLTQTAPRTAMPVPDDGNIVLHTLWSPDGNGLLVHSRGQVRLWKRSKPLARWQGSSLLQAWFDAEGRLLLRTSKGALELHPDGTTTDMGSLAPPAPDNAAPALTLSLEPNGIVPVWRGKIGGQEASDPLPHPSPVTSTALAPANRYLATCTQDKTLRVWELATGLLVTPPIPVMSGQPHLAWDATKHRLAVWTDHEVVLFDW
jgi:serine/threonine protein kinase